MANTAQKRHLTMANPPNLRNTGRGVIGAIGKPPGFKTVIHPPEKTESSSSKNSGRVGSCGTVYK